jgi:hypothetical protein
MKKRVLFAKENRLLKTCTSLQERLRKMECVYDFEENRGT